MENVPDWELDINRLFGQSSNFQNHFPGNQEKINASGTYDDLILYLISITIQGF